MSNNTILVIDYEPRSIEKTRNALVGAGYQVEFATDGVTGLKLFEKLRPALVLVEAMIPKKNGFEVCQEIKRTPLGQQTPVIITTSVYKGRRYRTQAIHNHRCDEYLEKPVPDEQLLGCVAKFIGEPGFTSAPPESFGGSATRDAASDMSDVIELDPEIIEAVDGDSSTHDIEATAQQGSGPNDFAANPEEVGLENEIVSRLDALLSISGETDTAGDVTIDQAMPSAPATKAESSRAEETQTAVALAEEPEAAVTEIESPATFDDGESETVEDEVPGPAPEVAPRSGKKSRKGRRGGKKHGRNRSEPDAAPRATETPVAPIVAEPKQTAELSLVRADTAAAKPEAVSEVRVEEKISFPLAAAKAAPVSETPTAASQEPSIMPPTQASRQASTGAVAKKEAPPPRKTVLEAAPVPQRVAAKPGRKGVSWPTWVALGALVVIAAWWALFGTTPRSPRARPAPPPSPQAAIPTSAAVTPAAETAPAIEATEEPLVVEETEPAATVPLENAVTESPAPPPAVKQPVAQARPKRNTTPPTTSTTSTAVVRNTEPSPATTKSPAPKGVEAERPAPAATTAPETAPRTVGIEPVAPLLPQAPPTPRVKAGDFVLPAEVDAAPIIVQRVMPSYTAKARALRQEGVVELSLVVDEAGSVRDVRVLRGIEGSDLDEAAADAVSQWRYKPAVKDGVPVKTTRIEKISFRL